VYTALDSPHDIVTPAHEAAVETERCGVQARSVVVLEAAKSKTLRTGKNRGLPI
jgi:hypothetical protein